MSEGYKGGVHAVAFGVGLVLAAYNLGELFEKRDKEHALNVAIYVLFCGFELSRVMGHCR